VFKIRTLVRLALIMGGTVLLLAFIGGAGAYFSAISLHRDPGRVPSSTLSAPSPKWDAAVERGRQLVRTAAVERNLPGLSVAVGVGGDVVWAEGFGWADLKARTPVTPATRFRIGTASTVLTSAAVGVLVDEGRLALDEPIRTRVPGFPEKPWPVTLRQLMGDVAGVASDDGVEKPLVYERCERPVDALKHFSGGDLLFQPGTQYRQSKYGWVVVSAAVEAAAGQPFLAFMQERVFQPSGMAGTYAESTKEENPDHAGEPGEDAPPMTFVREVILEPLGIVSKRAVSATAPAPNYAPLYGTDPRNGVHLMRPQNLSCYAGSMAFLSTPSDLVRFAMAIHAGKLLRPDTVKQLQTSPRLVSGTETGHGLGWDLGTVTLGERKTSTIGHDGALQGGMVASLVTFPEQGIVVSVTSNVSHADTASLAQGIAQAFASR
jgi:serine beta-lactamase-like protein LACTB, mitochondrial